MEQVNYDDLFGSFSAKEALDATTKASNNSNHSGRADIFKPSINDEKCTDQNYRALIRFIPFFHEGKWRTTVCRWECFLKDVNGNNGIFVVSPKTDNKKCPMRDLSFRLYKSESAIDRENSKKIQVYQQYYALIEVIKDVQHPEYNGKVFIYQFGQKINDKIENAMKSTDFTEGFNPFDFYAGKLFEINITKDSTKKMDNGRTISNYEACHFIEKTSPIHFTVNDEKMTLTREDRESQKAFLNWLENDAPKIKDYFWKEWDADTLEKVNTNLATYIGYTAPRTKLAEISESIEKVTETDKTSVPVNPVPVVETHDEFAQPMVTESAESAPAENVSSDEEWINSILNG